MMSNKHRHPVFVKSLLGILSILSFGIYLFSRGTKEKNEFIKVTGTVTYYSDNYLSEDYPYRYLKIDKYPRVFALGIPHDSLNKNYLFKYNEIKIGDVLDVYFVENKFEQDQRVNRGMRYIDKNEREIYLNRPNDKLAGVCFIGAGLLILLLVIVLKQKGKIE